MIVYCQIHWKHCNNNSCIFSIRQWNIFVLIDWLIDWLIDSRPGACLPARLLAWYWQNFPREFTENCFTVFDQSSRVILLTWYCRLYFFPWIPRGDPLNGSVKDFLSYCRGVNIIQFCSISVSFSCICIFFISKLRC